MNQSVMETPEARIVGGVARAEVTLTVLGISVALDYGTPPADSDVKTPTEQANFVRWFLERAHDVYCVMTEHDHKHFGDAVDHLAHVRFHHRCPCCSRAAPTLVFSHLDSPDDAHSVRTFEGALDAVFITELNRNRTPWLEQLDYVFVPHEPNGERH